MCEECNFTAPTLVQLQEHHADKHTQSIQIKCKSCDFQAENTSSLTKHKAEKHKQNQVTVDKTYLDRILEENVNLKGELSHIKEDFERLHEIFDNSRNSSQEQDKSSDIELKKVREEYRIVKTENEFLKEKNETLFKLGKIALDKKNSEPEVEVLEDEDDSGLDVLIKSARENKANRYVRRDPASYAEKAKATEATKPPTNEAQPNKARENRSETKDTTNRGVKQNTNRVNYCHYFSNYGKCHFEEKNGRPCKFSHLKAPVCSFDGRCNRKKCMFSHTKPDISAPKSHGTSNTQNNFLERGQQRSPPLQQQVAFLMQQMQQMQHMQNQPEWVNARSWY